MRALRRFFLVLGLIAVVGLLAVACEGGGEEEGGATPAPAGTEAPSGVETPGASPTAGAKPGDAGIPSNPRPVRGLEGILELDDGLAMWKERPADEDRTGVTDDAIIIGRSASITGAIAGLEFLWGPFIDAIFERINEAGGIHGRKLVHVRRDDQYNVQTGVQVAQQLVQEDKIFMTFLSMGGPIHTATHDFLAENNVPELYVFAGEQNAVMHKENGYWVPNRTDFPMVDPNIVEGYSLASILYEKYPDAKVAAVYNNDSYGQTLLEGAEWAAKDFGTELVAEIAHDPAQIDLAGQAQQVVQSGATAVVYLGLPTQSISLLRNLREVLGSDIPYAQRGHSPPQESELFDGAYWVRYTADPFVAPAGDPVGPALKKLAHEEEFFYNEVLTHIAFVGVEHLVRALELAGPDLTREGLLEALETGFTGDWTCATCIGPTVYSPYDHWALETILPARWSHADQMFCSIHIEPGEGCRPDDFYSEAWSFETSFGNGFVGRAPGWECAPDNFNCPWKQ